MIFFLPGTPQLLVELFVGNEGEILRMAQQTATAVQTEKFDT